FTYTTAGLIGITPYNIEGVYSTLASFNPINWLQSIYLPLGSAVGLSSFFGFKGFVANFYELNGVASLFGGAYWILLNVLFWTGWININLAFFNCIPAIPLDGGHILREVVKKMSKPFTTDEISDKVAKAASAVVAAMMFGSIILLIAAPRLLN
ncbi:MAG: site-2 protease family protein, partial [Halobacteria archaeon]|nr:site-2 protease family protein [Halobacteria archaeon]